MTNQAAREWSAIAATIRDLALLSPLLLLQVACSAPAAVDSELHDRLQGYWEGQNPSGDYSITIAGDSLFYYARPDFQFDTTFTLPAGTDPQQLHAEFHGENEGEIVHALVKIEDGILSLAVNENADGTPVSFELASSHYDLHRAEPREGGPGAPAAEPTSDS